MRQSIAYVSGICHTSGKHMLNMQKLPGIIGLRLLQKAGQVLFEDYLLVDLYEELLVGIAHTPQCLTEFHGRGLDGRSEKNILPRAGERPPVIVHLTPKSCF